MDTQNLEDSLRQIASEIRNYIQHFISDFECFISAVHTICEEKDSLILRLQSENEQLRRDLAAVHERN